MRFYLGTHHPGWLWKEEFRNVPLFISHNQLRARKGLRPAVTRWALDSGGFTQIKDNPEGWPVGCEEPYVEAVCRYAEGTGTLDWASQQDWMCEPWMLHGRTIREHQERTVANYLRLKELAPSLPFIPVLQGWELDDYHHCADLFESAGVRLAEQPTVGVGSVCRREYADQIGAIMTSLRERGLQLHGFGVKTRGLAKYHHELTSADSLAWSFGARRESPLPGCSHGKTGMGSCANCPKYALMWREKVLSRMGEREWSLF